MVSNLLLAFGAVLLIWLIQYHWKRRRLYQIAAKLKGPTPLPIIGNALSFAGSNEDILNNAMIFMEKYSKSSPIPIWLGQRLFFGILEAKHLEIILNHPNALEKEDLYKYIVPVVGYGLLNLHVPKWKKHRKMIMPTFKQKILDRFMDIFSEQSIIMVNQLKKVAGKGNFDVFPYFSCYSLDTICETAMGIPIHAQTMDAPYVRWINSAMEVIFSRIFIIWYHIDFIFNMTSMAKKFQENCKKLRSFTNDVVVQKRIAYQEKMKDGIEAEFDEGMFKAMQKFLFICNEFSTYIFVVPTKALHVMLLLNHFVINLTQREITIYSGKIINLKLLVPQNQNSFLQQFIELSEKGENLTDTEILDEVLIIMAAGTDTTASMASFTLIMLGMYPDIQEKVYNEVIDAIGYDKPVECTDLPSFSYTEMVIKETMRIFPVGPILARSITGDIKLDENTVLPAGSSAAICTIYAHRDPKVWPNPLRFDPLRFLPEESAKRHPYSYIPFSAGPRNCIGLKYAMMSIKTVIATVVRKYHIKSSYEKIEDIKIRQDFLLKPTYGYGISIEERT